MKNALFHNFTTKPFTGYWDGKSRTFQPGDKQYMPEYLAKHYAKHLANSVLNEMGGKYETYTSPKFPEQVPAFMDLVNKACILDESETEKDQVSADIDLANKERPRVPTSVDNEPPQMLKGDESNDDENESFEGLKTT